MRGSLPFLGAVLPELHFAVKVVRIPETEASLRAIDFDPGQVRSAKDIETCNHGCNGTVLKIQRPC